MAALSCGETSVHFSLPFGVCSPIATAREAIFSLAALPFPFRCAHLLHFPFCSPEACFGSLEPVIDLTKLELGPASSFIWETRSLLWLFLED